jgi:hypothetical protein
MKPNKSKILNFLLRNIDKEQTITLLSNELKLTRIGVWKILKKLEKDKIILLLPIGTGKTSTYKIKLNWENPLLEKTLGLILTEQAMDNQRWIENFKSLENHVYFLIIYGSILHSPKEAKDIDLLGVTDKNNFNEIDDLIRKIQKTQIKKIHFLNFTSEELKEELNKNNKAFIEAVKKGIILFNQEKFIKFIRDLNL